LEELDTIALLAPKALFEKEMCLKIDGEAPEYGVPATMFDDEYVKFEMSQAHFSGAHRIRQRTSRIEFYRSLSLGNVAGRNGGVV
jgi:hypothetical protein